MLGPERHEAVNIAADWQGAWLHQRLSVGVVAPLLSRDLHFINSGLDYSAV